WICFVVSSSVKAYPSTSFLTLFHVEPYRSKILVKLDGLPISIALDIVAFAIDGVNIPDCRYSGTTLFILVAAIIWPIGKPILLASRPAVRFPKLPEGTQKLTLT